MRFYRLIILIIIQLLIINASFANSFEFRELESLAANKKEEVLETKLKNLFSNSTIVNLNKYKNASTFIDKTTSRNAFRIIHWNIERGYKLKEINEALHETEQYFIKNNELKKIKEKKFIEEVDIFNETQIFTLNEADIGMPRTQYNNTIRTFAEITKSNYYVFAPEFLELDDKYLKDKKINKNLYQGLHGNAIVSKFPILKSKIIRLPECYNWFEGELEELSSLEKAKRKAAKVFFNAPIISELRRGNRNALVATIELPNMAQNITVVSTHFENRCFPICRKKQMQYLLEQLKDINTPLILSGDFNNAEVSSEPTSFGKVIYRTVTDWQNLSRAIITWFNPLTYFFSPAILAFNTLRKTHDPTVPGLPIFFRNKSADLFWLLINFKFTDGNMFDFSDEKKLCYKGKDGKLANSNERILKGFKSTFKLIKSNLLFHFRFDWLFVKSLRIKGCQDNEDDFEDIKSKCKNFVPAFGRNLSEFNKSHNKVYDKETKDNVYRDFDVSQLSDHDPITCEILI